MPKNMCYRELKIFFPLMISFHTFYAKKYLLSTYHPSNTVLGTGDASVNTADDDSLLHGA